MYVCTYKQRERKIKQNGTEYNHLVKLGKRCTISVICFVLAT